MRRAAFFAMNPDGFANCLDAAWREKLFPTGLVGPLFDLHQSSIKPLCPCLSEPELSDSYRRGYWILAFFQPFRVESDLV